MRLTPVPRPFLAPLLALSLLVVWFSVASALHQAPFAIQSSRDLLRFGALNGDVHATHEWWRLVTSQWLHSQFLHLLFNVLAIGLTGSALEIRFGAVHLAWIYCVGGLAGQLASLIAYPDLVSSGASQAALAVCAAVLCLRVHRCGRIAALLYLAISLGLDLAHAHTLKAGHIAGLIVGLLSGLALKAKSGPAG
ncbi:MAG: rhomboid family intramembrane serine protease [Asticcacaulis sp.]|uniref:rhomboid family intramembrane serine protease n=1 Tax=Asticcacaulis sp. TaxID=1872648 RepID=UPI0039E29F59